MKLLSILLGASVFAQTPYDVQLVPSSVAHEISINKGSAALWQSLKKLHTRASLIMLTAHPDDEDGGMLTYESRGRGTRVSLLTLNRGEGGANVMSPDFFDALGLVRTQELLAADRYYGVNQYWTRVIDYGFSKTKAESMSHWTRDRVLQDVVRVVRTVRPLVITSVFVGGPSDGHGNHETAGAMAQAVFQAAGDPNVFPEQIRAGLRPWSPIKDYARVPGMFGRNANAPRLETHVEIPQGDYDAMLGASYVQISREGLGMQKSQNGGPTIPKAGPVSSAYHRFASKIEAAAKEADFFEGIDVSLMGIGTLAKGGEAAFVSESLRKINAAVEDAIAKFSAVNPERTAPALAAGMKETMALIAAVEKSNLSADSKYDLKHELGIKQVQFNNALVAALGLSLSVVVAPAQEPNARMAQFMGDPETFRVAIPGQNFGVKLHAVKQSTGAKLRELAVTPTQGRVKGTFSGVVTWRLKSTTDLLPSNLSVVAFPQSGPCVGVTANSRSLAPVLCFTACSFTTKFCPGIATRKVSGSPMNCAMRALGSCTGATTAERERPSAVANALLNCTCLIPSSCFRSYFESAERLLLSTAAIRANVSFIPAASAGAVSSGFTAENLAIASSTDALIFRRDSLTNLSSPPLARIPIPINETSMPS